MGDPALAPAATDAVPRASPSTQEAIGCPACGAAASYRFLYRKNGCAILRCTECGLGRTDATDFDPATYYGSGYFSGGHRDGYADYRGAEPVLRREFACTVEFLRRYVPAGRLLEIGCAYGFFLAEAKRHFEVSGIELAADAAAQCRRDGLAVLTGAADETNLRRLGTMDAIVMLDVVEHLPAPADTLALCVRHLKPGGVILITTGDFASLVARATGRAWRLMTPPQHLWFFTADSIQRLAARCNLRVANLDHPGKMVPASLIAFQIARMLGLRPRAASRASRVGVPVNLFDAMRVVLQRPAEP